MNKYVGSHNEFLRIYSDFKDKTVEKKAEVASKFCYKRNRQYLFQGMLPNKNKAQLFKYTNSK